MSFTYSPATDAGKVRMLITDRDEANSIFQDDEIDAFLEMEDGSIRLAAAMALEAIAANEALVLKKLVMLDTETDGPAVATALIKLAASYREQENSSGAFDIAEQTVNDFATRELWWKKWQRGE